MCVDVGDVGDVGVWGIAVHRCVHVFTVLCSSLQYLNPDSLPMPYQRCTHLKEVLLATPHATASTCIRSVMSHVQNSDHLTIGPQCPPRQTLHPYSSKTVKVREVSEVCTVPLHPVTFPPSPALPVVCTDKVALLIGNMRYRVSRHNNLSTPETDVQDLAGLLTSLDFKVGVSFKCVGCV